MNAYDRRREGAEREERERDRERRDKERVGEREIEERQREGGEMERERERERDLVSKFYVEVENYSCTQFTHSKMHTPTYMNVQLSRYKHSGLIHTNYHCTDFRLSLTI